MSIIDVREKLESELVTLKQILEESEVAGPITTNARMINVHHRNNPSAILILIFNAIMIGGPSQPARRKQGDNENGFHPHLLHPLHLLHLFSLCK